MQFISSKIILLSICICVFFSVTVTHQAYGDGLTMENLPPASVGDRQASLFIQISPPILTSDTVQDTYVKLRLFDANNNQTIKSDSFFVKIEKDGVLLMRDLFYTKSGNLTIKIKPTNTPGKWQAYGDIEPTVGGWTAVNDQVRVDAPVFLEGGLYHFEIKFIGIDATKYLFEQGKELTFNSYLSVGDVSKQPIKYQGSDYDLIVISYYDKIDYFKFDESKKLISYSMPFDWNLSRIEGQNIFVHEEIQIPNSFKEFVDSTTFTATVNAASLVGQMLAIDPYSKEDTLILHFLINKNDILDLAKKIPTDTKTMDFTLTTGGNSLDGQTSNSNEIKIPDWVRNNAKWWSEGSIGDRDFASGIQYLIKIGIIKIPTTENGQDNQNVKIPDWVRNNAKWWSEGSIGDRDFASGIQYLIKIGIISV